MKRIYLILVVLFTLLLGVRAEAAIAFVGAWTGAQGNNVTSGTFSNTGITTTGADTFIVVATSQTSTGLTVTDNKSNTFTLITGFPYNDTVGGDYVWMWISKPTTLGTGDVLTLHSIPSGNFVTIEAAAYSGLAASPYDVQAHAVDTSGTSVTLNSGNATTTSANELLIGAGTLSQGSNFTWTAGTGYTMRSSVNAAAAGGVGFLEDEIVSSTGSYNAQAGTTLSGDWVAAIVTFMAPGGAAPPPSRFFLGQASHRGWVIDRRRRERSRATFREAA